MIDSPSIRQLSLRETEVSSIVVSAWGAVVRAVIARGEEASEAVDSDVPVGPVGLSPFTNLRMDPKKGLSFEFETLMTAYNKYGEVLVNYSICIGLVA
jgi:hypothetical protein